MVTTLSTISSTGQIEIPEEYRQALGIEPNDQLALTLENGTIQVRRVPPPPGDDWFWVPARNEWVQWSEIQEIAHEETSRRLAQSIVDSMYGLARDRWSSLSIEDLEWIAEDEVVANAFDEVERSH